MHKLLFFVPHPQFQANFHVYKFLPLINQSLFLVPLLGSDSEFSRMCRTCSIHKQFVLKEQHHRVSLSCGFVVKFA